MIIDFDSQSSGESKVRVSFGSRGSPLGGFEGSRFERLRPRFKQVHGTSVCQVMGPGQECGEVDALFTSVPGLPLGVVTADCVPILLSLKSGQAIGAIHAGWRGTLAGSVDAFFKSIPEADQDPNAWVAWIGPSIRACCYEVSPELVTQFKTRFPKIASLQIEPNPRHLDLAKINEACLLSLGVKVESIDPKCTSCAQDQNEYSYFSYRRGDRNSRQISIIEIPIPS